MLQRAEGLVTPLPVSATAPIPAVETAQEGRAILERVRNAISHATYEPKVAVERIRRMWNQPRKYFNPERLLRLSESIKSVGQITPGYLRIVSPDAEQHDRELVDGERRWQAILMGGLPTFRAMIVDVDDEAAQFIMSVIANFNREGHTALEVADAIRVSHEQLKLGMQEIGEMIGFSKEYCTNLYGLRRLTPSVRDLLDPERGTNRRLPVSAAIELSRLPEHLQLPLAERLLRRDVNLRGLRNEVVNMSERHGLPIQKRTVYPNNQRHRLAEKISLVRRTTVDLQKRLEETEPSVLNGWGYGTAMVYRNELEAAQEALAASVKVVDGVVRRKLAGRE
ncbi:MAG: ParB/RepB/Spo0J family partition protein [Minisyncoccia bacterium]